MATRQEDRKRAAPLIAVLLIALLAAPVAYFLSLGPMVVQLDRGEISKPQFDHCYLPLLATARVSPLFRGLCETYVDYWREKPSGLIR